MTWSEFGKLSLAEKPNDEVAIDFAGPFQNASKGKKSICWYQLTIIQDGQKHFFYQIQPRIKFQKF